ncbi:LysR family transcriptional regulator [Megamonas funiformis]|uniref:LysR family transcriptional regulator n=1 Tax=Megamonas funiformis TaxID=437897 RepID=UPI000E4D86C7|nr:LysR family transcriptional regulator [Megamonas funiformis]RHG08816.1 LysR family transcriptional regulator [Megamonas funiformis]
MEFRLLKYFLMVAHEENITKAANLLHITQPTLSRQLIQLEEELGVTLFQRSKHRIILTEDGMLLRRRANEIISLMEKTQQELTKECDDLVGEISIGCGETQNMSYLSQKIKEFHKVHPLVKFHIHSTTADEIKERIENGLLDMGLVTEPVDISKYNFFRLPQKEQWGILVHEKHRLAQKTFITPNDLINEPLIIAKRTAVQNELINWFNNSSEKLNIVATYNLILNAANMVKHQIGVALCFNLNFDNLYQDLRFIPLFPEIKTGAVLIWKKNHIYSQTMFHFIKSIKNA